MCSLLLSGTSLLTVIYFQNQCFCGFDFGEQNYEKSRCNTRQRSIQFTSIRFDLYSVFYNGH